MLGKADIDAKHYERTSSVDGSSLDRFERHLAEMHTFMKKFRLVIRCNADIRKHREVLGNLKFFYHRGF